MQRLRTSAARAPLAALIAVFALAAGCASAPVQEMSDARQAIQAAEEAGAASVAPEALSDARRLLASAQQKLSRQAYNGARADAREARRRAAEALDATREDDGP